MNYQTVQVKKREDDGAASLKKMRAAGEMPAVLSRGGTEPVSLAVSAQELSKAVRKTGVGGILELVDDGGKKHLGLLKELQWHPVTRKLYHASFQEVKSDQVVNTTVHLTFVGEPQPIADKSGQFIKAHESIEIHAKVSAIPDHLTVDISNMQVGDVITAADIALPDGVEALHKDTVICSVTTPQVVNLETPTAETDAIGEAVAEPAPEARTE